MRKVVHRDLPKVTQLVASGFEPRKSALKPTHFNYCTKDWWSPPPLGSSQCHLWLVTLSGSPGGNCCQATDVTARGSSPWTQSCGRDHAQQVFHWGSFWHWKWLPSPPLFKVAADEWWFWESTPANIIFRALFMSAPPIKISRYLSPCQHHLYLNCSLLKLQCHTAFSRSLFE